MVLIRRILEHLGLWAPLATERRILRQPDVQERLSNQGVEVIGSQPAEFAQFIKAEISKFARVVASSDARFD